MTDTRIEFLVVDDVGLGESLEYSSLEVGELLVGVTNQDIDHLLDVHSEGFLVV